MNHAELLDWLKKRWENNKVKTRTVVIPQKNYKYRINNRQSGQIIDSIKFDAYLKSHAPWYKLISDVWAWKHNYPYKREDVLCPRDNKAYRNFDWGICYGCVYCLAIEEINEGKGYVYCKYPCRISVGNDFPTMFYRLYSK